MVYLALSCLQGRQMQPAAEELLSLGVEGLQLTPGLAPTPDFSLWLEQQGVKVRTHHGFSWQHLNRRVWSDEGDCLVASDSVHPPQTNHLSASVWKNKAENGDYRDLILETMYPQYLLGGSEELNWAMDLNLQLAVDVSHIYIQLCQGSLSKEIWLRLQNYENIQELHLSANKGNGDIHQPLNQNSFGLDWVKERSQNAIPLVLECYMHRLSQEERLEQLELINI